MPIKVFYRNQENQPCTIRPTPFVQISENVLKNKEGSFGVTYNITLTGTLLAKHGTPYAVDPAKAISSPLFDAFDGNSVEHHVGPTIGPYKAFDNVGLGSNSNYKPVTQKITGDAPDSNNNLVNKPASAILSKQRALRALFADDGQRVEISDVLGNTGSTVTCFPRVVNIDFTEGNYITKCEYTIVLEADYLLRGSFDSAADASNAIVDYADLVVNHNPDHTLGIRRPNNDSSSTSIGLLYNDKYTAFIEDYSETWSLEVDDNQAESDINPRTYRISHTLNATGKSTYFDPRIANTVRPQNMYDDPEKDKSGNAVSAKNPAWVQAKKFVMSRLASQPSGSYPNFAGHLGSGTMDLVESYRGYNHVRTENIDVTNGSFSVTENWLLASGNSYENFSLSTSTSNTDPFINVSIDGNIKGLNNLPPFFGQGGHPSGTQGNPKLNIASGAYTNALSRYNSVTNSGQFGLSSEIFKRANNIVAVELNSQPVSISLSTNQIAGEISYNLAFNNRPTNIISGVLAESIQVNDTYPGDIFAVIPVLGRATGPILQYVGGRSEYKRDVSINLTMDYTKIPYGKERNPLLLKKPSLVEPTATQIAELLNELSPQGEPGVRKYFISPPSESWSPKEGAYSFNISWTYELDR
jgi:hypothetical protein